MKRRCVTRRPVLEAFERAGGAGAVQLEGKMLDKPHLTQALRVLASAGQAPETRRPACPDSISRNSPSARSSGTAIPADP